MVVYLGCFLFFFIMIGFFIYKLFDGGISIQESQSDYQLEKEKEKEIEMERSIESVKSSLRSLDLENSIGKVDKEDFHILQKEYISQWKKFEEDSKK